MYSPDRTGPWRPNHLVHSNGISVRFVPEYLGSTRPNIKGMAEGVMLIDIAIRKMMTIEEQTND